MHGGLDDFDLNVVGLVVGSELSLEDLHGGTRRSGSDFLVRSVGS